MSFFSFDTQKMFKKFVPGAFKKCSEHYHYFRGATENFLVNFSIVSVVRSFFLIQCCHIEQHLSKRKVSFKFLTFFNIKCMLFIFIFLILLKAIGVIFSKKLKSFLLNWVESFALLLTEHVRSLDFNQLARIKFSLPFLFA